VPNTDLSAMSVINYAVRHLQVKHVIACGRYGCGGVKATMMHADLGLLNPWLRSIRDVYRLYEKELDVITDKGAQYDRLVELNTMDQARNVTEVQQSFAKNCFPVECLILGIDCSRISCWTLSMLSPIYTDSLRIQHFRFLN
jgi:carbonic anhydrase